jgi:spore coat protein I
MMQWKEELSSVARAVLKNYDIIPEDISVIQSGTIKTVWKVKTGKGFYCLKRLKHPMEKALFSVNAQIYISENGGKVPVILRNIQGSPITAHNGQLFVIYEWIDGTGLNFGNREDLRKAVKGLAEFHIASRGYIPVSGARISSKLGKWPAQYLSMRSRMEAWRELALNNRPQGSYEAYLRYSPPIIGMADRAYNLLKASAYQCLSSDDSASKVLCHQDYGKGNALLFENRVYVLDLDGVTFDLPARDLRKIIGKNAENNNKWNSETVSEIIYWYAEVNPLGTDELEVLYIDLLFPHWYFGLLKNLFQAGKQVRSQDIEKIGTLEKSKELVINELLEKSSLRKTDLPHKE